MGETWNKKERQKKKQKAKLEKAEKMKDRKDNATKKNMNDMIAYVDDDGHIVATPPDPRNKKEFKLEDIEIGVPEYVPPAEGELTHTGRITFFNQEKGFGFVKDQVTQESIFIHANNLTEPVKESDKISFEIENGPRGPVAVNAKIIN
jgi:cold shock CspA family protein